MPLLAIILATNLLKLNSFFIFSTISSSTSFICHFLFKLYLPTYKINFTIFYNKTPKNTRYLQYLLKLKKTSLAALLQESAWSLFKLRTQGLNQPIWVHPEEIPLSQDSYLLGFKFIENTLCKFLFHSSFPVVYQYQLRVLEFL